MQVQHPQQAPSMASTAFSEEDDQASQVLAEIQKLESILLEQLDKETARFGNSSSSISKGITGDLSDVPSSATTPTDLDGASSINFSQYLDAQQDAKSSVAGGPARSIAQSSAYWSQAGASSQISDDASDLMDNQSCTSLRKELSQVVTPYGHVSQRVQAFEDLTPAQLAGVRDDDDVASQTGSVYRTGAFAGTDGSSVVGSVASGINDITQRTAALSTADVQSTASVSQPPSMVSPSVPRTPDQIPTMQSPHEDDPQALLSQTQKIKSLLQNLESQLTQVSAAASNIAANPKAEIQNSIRSLSFLEDSLKHSLTPLRAVDESSSETSSSFAAQSRTRLNNIRQKLWGGPSPVQQRQRSPDDFAAVEGDDVEEEEEDVDNASVVGQISTDFHHYPPPTRETVCCDPAPKREDLPVRPREDYFSAAYQNAFSCNSAYHLDVPEPGTANVSSTPNAAGGKNYYYYYPPPEPNVAAACCKLPPMERLLSTLKRLEVRVASCHASHLQRRRRQQQDHMDGAILQQYELADLDLTNPARAERYHDL